MTAILKVDTIQDTSGNNIINESSDTITIGASGDTSGVFLVVLLLQTVEQQLVLVLMELQLQTNGD